MAAGFFTKLLCILLTLLGLSLKANSQDQLLNFSHLNINNGLSQNTVFSIIQDSDGFIWIGTKDGLNRYDGYDFTIFKHVVNDSTSLSHSQVNTIIEDSKGFIWIGTAGGLNRFDRSTESFINFPLQLNSPTEAVTSLLEDRNGNLWIGTFDGLVFYDVDEATFLKFKPDLLLSSDPQQVMVQEIYEDDSGILWVSIGGNLFQFNPQNRSFLPLPATLREATALKDSEVRVIKQDAEGNFWIGTEYAGLFLYQPQKQKVRQFTTSGKLKLPSMMVRDIFIPEGKDPQVWIGTREGLCILNAEKNQITNFRYDKLNNKSLTHNSIRCIVEDTNGSIWIGTFAGGLNIFHPNNNNFIHIKEQIADLAGVNHRVVSSLVEDDNGIWIGTEGGGLNYLDQVKNEFVYFTSENTNGKIPGNNIKSLEVDPKGNLWVGTYEGLSYLTKAENKLTLIYPDEKNSLENLQMYALCHDNNGLWIGTNGGGLYFRSEDGSLKNYRYNSEDRSTISGNNVITLLDDNEGLWVGTEQGLNYFNKKEESFTRYIHDPNMQGSITSNNILYSYKDSRDLIWIGTEGGGLNLFDREERRFFAITEEQGLANNVVHAIGEDEAGNLWLSTNKGISELLINAPLTGESLPNIQFNNYVVGDGLQSNQFLTGSIAKGRDGKLIFGGINGITIFYPDRIVNNTVPPKVVLTDFLINNKEVNFKEKGSSLEKPIWETQDLTLSHDQSSITFKFSALNFVNPEKNQYAYRLKGLQGNSDWNYVGHQRNATFTNLSPGQYLFEVKGSNNDGIWAIAPATVQITILPPFWKTWWAFLLYAIFIISLLVLFYIFSVKNAHLKNKLTFEHMAHVKENELNNRKHRFFTNISHEIKTPLTLILSPIERLIRMNEGNNMVLNQLMLMQRNGDRLLKLLNQLLDFRKFETGSMKLHAAQGDVIKFIYEVFLAFEVYANNRNIELTFNSEEDEIPLWFDRDKMEKILYNLLSNAIKFTPKGGKISLNVRAADDDKFAIIEVEDNGVGIPEENFERIFERYNNFDTNNPEITGTGIGLAFTKGLVELHQGEITVASKRPDSGIFGYTCFRVMLPKGKAHLTEDQIIPDFQSSEDIAGYMYSEVPIEKTSIERKKKIIGSNEEDRPIVLLVEDNVDVLQMLSDHFSNEFEVITAPNGEQGFNTAIDLIPDIIISDVMMPVMNGIDLCKKIKSDSRTSHIPMILLTARTPLIFKIEGFETGADDYITKPFNFYILESRVYNLLESRRKLRERYRKEMLLQPKNVSISSPDEKFLEKVIKYIEDNISEPTLNVEELGKEVGMSRMTLYRKVKALTNHTVVEFIRDFRIKRAAQLLTEKKLQVNEIAYMVGFQDVDYFRKCFKEQFHCTPSEFGKDNEVQTVA